MKKQIALLIILSSANSYAGIYDSQCYEKHGKQQAYSCLEDMLTKAQSDLDTKMQQLKTANAGYSRIKEDDIQKSHYLFESYIDNQCSLISKLTTGSGISQMVQDCRIHMIKNRIKDINYIVKDFK